MSLATRCTACGTIFRVVQDQLRVSEGFVRCGRCAEVFDAREQLFDIDREPPPPWPAQAAGEAKTAPFSSDDTPASPQAPDDGRASWQQEDEPIAVEDWQDDGRDARPAPPAPLTPPARHVARPAHSPTPVTHAHIHEPADDEPLPISTVSNFDETRLEPQWVDNEEQAWADTPSEPEPASKAPAKPHSKASGRGAAPAAAKTPAVATEPAIAPVPDDKPDVVLSERLAAGAAKPTKPSMANGGSGEENVPSFLRQSNSAKFWQRTSVRAGLSVAALLLMLTLSVQVLQHFHDAIAALFPSARPAVQSYCQLSGCELKPWQRIDQIAVESTALSQLSPGNTGNHYQLAISLRNKGHIEVATPWVELSLTDSTGALISRRLLAPKEFRIERAAAAASAASAPSSSASGAASGATANALAASPDIKAMPAGAELPLLALLSTGQQSISGYTVEIFYP
ncbi:zinc-ribbon and DUF3426 domain-containing protein [Roseateles sp. PN1]|uniref:zinc-ribbon and DUF3426 domain-containing protein n=1 Tax=Roseateles sp. PN1 TaxID=3137372 RepID=UPI00313A05D5